MGVNEAWQYDVIGAVELCNLLSVFFKPGMAQNIFGPTNRNNFSAGTKHRTFSDNPEFFEFRPAAWTSGGATEREELADVGQE